MKAIEVDAHLRVKGAPLGTVYAVGDASSVSDMVTAIDGYSDVDNPRWKQILSVICLP